MSKDIRSFFQVKKVKKVIEEDSDVIPESPEVHNSKNKKKQARKRRQIADDSDEEISVKNKKNNHVTSNTKSSSNKSSLKEIKLLDVLDGGPIKRSEPLVKRSKKNTETGIHSDDDFEMSLIEIDQIEETHKHQPKDTELNKPKETIPQQTQINIAPEKQSFAVGTISPELVNENSKLSKGTVSQTTKDTKVLTQIKSEETKHSHSSKESKSHISKQRKSHTSEETKSHTSKDTKSPAEKDTKSDTIKDTQTHKAKESQHNEKEKYNHVPNENQTKSSISKIKQKERNENTNIDASSKLSKFKKQSPVKKDKRDFSEFLEDDHKTEAHNVSTQDTSEPKQKKAKMDKSLNTSVMSDEERHEKKRYSAVLYQKYLNRSGPKHLGSKEIPKGKPNCLQGCAFLLTGVLDSFERDEVVAAIKEYGGVVKNSISKKVTHVIAGEDAGPAKLAKAEELGITILNEDQFLKLISESNSSPTVKEEKSKCLKANKKDRSKSPVKKEKDINGVVKEEKNNDHSTSSSKLNVTDIKKERKSVTPKKKSQLKIKDEEKTPTADLNADNTALNSTPVNSLMWVDKYKPQNLKQIIGQHGEASNVKKLSNWLTKWYVNRKAKLPKPNPWAKNDDGGYYKAALLSGPPGVGKTTTVSLVCKELGFDTVEFNASDTRNKTLIREQIGELLTTTSLSGYAKGSTGKGAVTKKHVLVMDEVDGMAGNEDRGGLQELISLIKSTSVPIICMCNDRNSEKMRTLVNYCYDLRFSRPRVDQIKSALLSICFKEAVKIPADVIGQLVVAAGQDVRQSLHLLSVWAADCQHTDSLRDETKRIKKDVKMGPWEAIRKVFSAEEHKTMTIHDKSDLFFTDYSLEPLFVQENYLSVAPHCPKHEVLQRMSKAADAISWGDIVDARIRRNQAWGLLPVQAMFSSVIPGQALAGHVAGQIQFPGWLGKNSRHNKMRRLAQEIHAHTRLSTSGSKSSIFLDYASHLRDAIVTPLIKERNDGIDKSLEVLESYHLLREDLESLTELSLWPSQINPMNLIDSKVKAAMTRTYNKTAPSLPYAPGLIKKARHTDDDAEDPLGDNEDDDSDPENDALIKKKKKEDKPSTSKQQTSKKPSSAKEKKKKK